MAVDENGTMDFVSDQLYDSKSFRGLTLTDLFTRECLATYADKASKGKASVRSSGMSPKSGERLSASR